MLLLQIFGIFSLISSIFTLVEYSYFDYPYPCPKNIRYVKNVDSTRIQGLFFIPYDSSNSSSVGCDGTCRTTYFGRLINTQTLVSECCQVNNQQFCGEELGSGFFSLSEGVLNYTSGALNENALFLDTDYDNYIIGYGCTVINGQKIESLDIGTRVPHPDPEYIKLAKEAIKSSGLDLPTPVRLVPMVSDWKE